MINVTLVFHVDLYWFFKLSIDIPERLTRIPMKTYRRIVRGLAEKEHWKQMHITVMEYRKNHSNTGLHDFAEGLSIMRVIKCDQLQQSKDLITTIIDNMLKSGGTLSEGICNVSSIKCQAKFS